MTFYSSLCLRLKVNNPAVIYQRLPLPDTLRQKLTGRDSRCDPQPSSPAWPVMPAQKSHGHVTLGKNGSQSTEARP